MVTPRYHYGTIVAVFIALGLGILLGGSLGQQWLSEQQQEILKKLEAKYDEVSEKNQQLEQQVKELNEAAEAFESERDTLWREGLKNMLKDEKILFLNTTDGQFSPKLIEALQAAGSTVSLSSISDVDQSRLEGTSLFVLHPQLLQEESYQWIVQDIVQTQTAPIILLNEKNVPNWLSAEGQTELIVPIDLSKMDERLGSLAFVRIAQEKLEEAKEVIVPIPEEVLPDAP